MRRTQIQIPDPLYAAVKRVAELNDWSVSEVIRRAAEELVAQYPMVKEQTPWRLPEGRNMGVPKVAPETWRDELAEDVGRFG